MQNLHKISVEDTVKLTLNKGDFFGIEGYNLPHKNYPEYSGIKNMFSKEKGKNFAEI